jgi:hypothetical protein
MVNIPKQFPAIVVGIYCEKYPHEIGPLMKYAHTIQNLARPSCDIAAFMYNKTFRQWRETAWVYLPCGPYLAFYLRTNSQS